MHAFIPLSCKIRKYIFPESFQPPPLQVYSCIYGLVCFLYQNFRCIFFKLLDQLQGNACLRKPIFLLSLLGLLHFNYVLHHTRRKMLLIPKSNTICSIIINDSFITNVSISKSRSLCFWAFYILNILLWTNKIIPSHMKI